MVAEKIRASLAAPYMITIKNTPVEKQVIEHHCTASIGVVLFLSADESEEDIIQRADHAMYRAKENGRNTIYFSG